MGPQASEIDEYLKLPTREVTCSNSSGTRNRRQLPSRVQFQISLSNCCYLNLRKRRRPAKPISLFNISLLSLCLLLRCADSSAQGSAPRITIQPNDLIAIEGESAELNCDAEGDPEPSIEWHHNGQLIKASTNSRTTMGGSIQFLDIRPSSGSGGQVNKPQQNHPPATDTGIYYCLARNSFGQAQSRNASLQVAYIKPEFRAWPKDKFVAIGETVTFDCMPRAWPEPRIQWRRNGQLIEPNEGLRLTADDSAPKYSINRIASADLNTQVASRQEVGATGQLVDHFGSQLVIRQVEKQDEGKYSCLVETNGSHRLIERESPQAQLVVGVKPYFIEAPEHRTAQVGGQLRLRCRMGGDPEPVISWRKQNGQPLSEKAQIDPIDKTLTLDQLTIADQAIYVCEGENSLGSAKSLATVTVKSRPKFIVQPEDQEVDPGARVQIKCAGEASPPPMLFWYKEGHRQLMFPAPSAATAQSQQLSPLDWPQAAPLTMGMPEFQEIYKNSGSTQATSDISPAINKLFTMPVNADQFYAPSVNYGNNYFGNRIYVDNQGTLNIINATSNDNGYYACALISSVGSVMGKAKLTVKQALGSQDYFDSASPMDSLHSRSGSNSYQNNNNKFDLLPPPVIKLGAANQTLPTNSSATLVCDVVSQVAYKIQWFFESQPLQEDIPRVMVLETGSLSISNLRTSDSGIYTCIVTAANDQTMPLAAPFEPLDSSMLTSAPPIQLSTSHSTMLKVANPLNFSIPFYRMDTFAYPSSPGPAYLVSTNGNDAITIAWAAPADSGTLPIKEYVIEHYDTSQEHLGWRVIYRIKGKESLLIDGLSADGSHFFVIRAANSHGVGPSSAIAGPMRTVAGEARYKDELQKRRWPADSRRPGLDGGLLSNSRADTNLARERLMSIATNLISLTPVSSTSIRLQWSTQMTENATNIPSVHQSSDMNFPLPNALNIDDILEGYSIRFRAVRHGDSQDPSVGQNWNNAPASLPLVTSYVDPDEEPNSALSRRRRDVFNYVDYSQEFNEVRVVDHKTEHYTINTLRPFTLYQFFVVPYYKDIDGVPSNILSAQTNEDRPSIAPPNLTIRPINNTAVRLLWVHVPPIYANGILRGYLVRVNRSDVLDIGEPQQNSQQVIRSKPIEPPRILTLPLNSLNVAPLTGYASQVNKNQGLNNNQPNNNQQYIVMHDLANLTYKSFYSIQIAAMTSVGPGPWGESQNFIMDPKVLAELKVYGNDFDDVMSKSLIPTTPQSYNNLVFNSTHGYSHSYLLYILLSLVLITIIFISGYLLYRRNNQKVINWKKTISEHFNNKFYMPAAVDEQEPNSIQQNIYDHHQQHLIYSTGPQMAVQQAGSAMPTTHGPAIWANKVCINSGGAESLSPHAGALLPMGTTEPISLNRRLTGAEQSLLMNQSKDQRFHTTKQQNGGPQLINQRSVDSARSLSHHHQQQQALSHQQQSANDYYSVINNMSEYEELDPQQRGNIQTGMSNGDRHQTASSNSDTSCPSSVTRLLPNQNYNRDLLKKQFSDNQHDMVLQQVGGGLNDGKQPFATIISGHDQGRLQTTMVPLSPYATTNLMSNQVTVQQHFQQQSPAHHLMTMNDHAIRQQKFILHNGGMTMDDSSKALLHHHQQQQQLYDQQVNVVHNPMSVFRTLQRNPISFQSRANQQFNQQPHQQVFMKSNIGGGGIRLQNNHPDSNTTDHQSPFQSNGLIVTNITQNPLSDNNMKLNVYEHIDYSDSLGNNQAQNHHHNQAPSNQNSQTTYTLNGSQVSNEIISSSSSSGSMKSSPDHQQQQRPQSPQNNLHHNRHQSPIKSYRRGSNVD